MGLFTRQPAVTWQPDGTGVMDAGDCGGDVQDGRAYSIRFVNLDLPGRTITVTYIPVRYPEWGREWGVERRVEWAICSGLYGEPWWEDEETGLVNDTSIHRKAEAERLAREWAAEDVAGGAELYGTWDGEPA